jgi:hypothetical protein
MKARHLWRSRLRVEELEGRWVPSAVLGTSTNWSGYAVTTGNGAVSAVSGNWAVPAVLPTVSGYSSAWVGIDGVGRNATVEQIGTDSDFVNGAPQYYAWYEMYPAAPVYLSTGTYPVVPGDTMSASVTASVPGVFQLSIADTPQGASSPSWSFTTTQTLSSARQNTAEWIMEAPSNIFGVLPLADFVTINFSQARATISGTPGLADNGWSGTTLYQINMITPTGALKASTGPLTDAGNPTTSSFGVTWVSSGSSSGGGHHGKHTPTNAQPDSSQVSLSLAVARAFVQSGAAPQAPTPPAPAPAVAAAPSAIIVPSVAPLFGQPPVTVAGRAQDAGV